MDPASPPNGSQRAFPAKTAPVWRLRPEGSAKESEERRRRPGPGEGRGSDRERGGGPAGSGGEWEGSGPEEGTGGEGKGMFGSGGTVFSVVIGDFLRTRPERNSYHACGRGTSGNTGKKLFFLGTFPIPVVTRRK